MAAKDLSASGVLFTDRRNFYIDPQVTKELWTDVTPFTTVIANKETRNVPDPVFKMFEHKQPWIKQTFHAASDPANAADGTESAAITIDDGAGGTSLLRVPHHIGVCRAGGEFPTRFGSRLHPSQCVGFSRYGG